MIHQPQRSETLMSGFRDKPSNKMTVLTGSILQQIVDFLYGGFHSVIGIVDLCGHLFQFSGMSNLCERVRERDFVYLSRVYPMHTGSGCRAPP
jgi:hypothetical protein